MIYNFSIPTIEDDVDFTKLLKYPLPPDAMKDLQDYNEARKSFKAIVNEAYIKNKNYGEFFNFSSYKDQVERYLSINVDLMRIMCKAQTAPIELRWKTFLTKLNSTFLTKGGNEETMAIELVIVRYCWAFAYYAEAEPHVIKIREKVVTTFKQNSATSEDFEKSCKDALRLMYIGWEKLRKLQNVIHLVSKSIVLESNCDFVEGKGKFLDVVKGLLEVNANSIFLELLRMKKEYLKIAKVCYANIVRLKFAKTMFEDWKNNLREDLLQYIDLGIKFFKAFGMWGLISYYEALIVREDYSKKKFARLTQEIWSMADQTLALCAGLKKFKVTDANVAYCTTYANFFEPTCIHSFQLYQEINKGLDVLDGEKCLAEAGEESYLEQIWEHKNASNPPPQQ